MSGTLLNSQMIMDFLGIDPADAECFRMANRFPIGNRPIYKSYAGSMSFKKKHQTMPKLIKEVERICKHYQEYRGIIHTHNFEIAEKLMENCTRDVSSRFLFQRHFWNKEEMLQEHQKRTNGIIVAPAMHEGLDLFNDRSRFQLICKMPYPNFNADNQLKKRMKQSPNYYQYLTALKLVQSVGRSVRSEKDWADTYVLDEDFERFIRWNRFTLPKWFIEAIHE